MENLKVLKALIEWEMPIDYQIIIDDAIEYLMEDDNGQSENSD